MNLRVVKGEFLLAAFADRPERIGRIAVDVDSLFGGHEERIGVERTQQQDVSARNGHGVAGAAGVVADAAVGGQTVEAAGEGPRPQIPADITLEREDIVVDVRIAARYAPQETSRRIEHVDPRAVGGDPPVPLRIALYAVGRDVPGAERRPGGAQRVVLHARIEVADPEQPRKIGPQQHVLPAGPENADHGVEHRIVIEFADVVAEEIVVIVVDRNAVVVTDPQPVVTVLAQAGDVLDLRNTEPPGDGLAAELVGRPVVAEEPVLDRSDPDAPLGIGIEAHPHQRRPVGADQVIGRRDAEILADAEYALLGKPPQLPEFVATEIFVGSLLRHERQPIAVAAVQLLRGLEQQVVPGPHDRAHIPHVAALAGQARETAAGVVVHSEEARRADQDTVAGIVERPYFQPVVLLDLLQPPSVVNVQPLRGSDPYPAVRIVAQRRDAVARKPVVAAQMLVVPDDAVMLGRYGRLQQQQP